MCFEITLYKIIHFILTSNSKRLEGTQMSIIWKICNKLWYVHIPEHPIALKKKKKDVPHEPLWTTYQDLLLLRQKLKL